MTYYIGSLFAAKPGGIVHCPALILADSRENAIKYAIDEALRLWPVRDHFFNHDASILLLEEAYTKISLKTGAAEL